MKTKQTKGLDPSKPHAWITSPSDKGRKSIKNGNKVYLQDGQNFEIELFNPLTESVLSDVKVNGSSVCKSGLVLRPGERFYLDCFVDDNKKFIFKTYDVEDTQQSKDAISKNGIIEVFFYKEETVNIKDWKNVFVPVIERRYYTYPYYYPYPWNNVTYGSGTGTITTNAFSCCTTNTSNIGTMTTSSSYFCNADMLNLTSSNSTKSIETGRVEKGDKSNQKFESVDMDFEKYHISNVLYQILPESQNPVETKDLIKKSKKEKIKDLENKVKELEKMIEKITK